MAAGSIALDVPGCKMGSTSWWCGWPPRTDRVARRFPIKLLGILVVGLVVNVAYVDMARKQGDGQSEKYCGGGDGTPLKPVASRIPHNRFQTVLMNVRP